MARFQTIPNGVDTWSTLDDRVWDHPGAIIDLGCNPWNWSEPFIGRKRVIGVDPLADPRKGTECFQGVIGPVCGSARLLQTEGAGEASTLVGSSSSVIGEKVINIPMLSWRDFCRTYQIGQIAALKINIEGSEYGLIHSMGTLDFDQIDQLVVSFHHWMIPGMEKATEAALYYLRSVGYQIEPIFPACAWYLCLR